jgi:uncharacterized coiled-coil protein SlyX
MTEDRIAALESRLMEVEIRSEERIAEIQKLEQFVAAYESRIRTMEAKFRHMQSLLEEPADEMPAALDDLPPHY